MEEEIKRVMTHLAAISVQKRRLKGTMSEQGKMMARARWKGHIKKLKK
jgi:hypothetical protein